MARDPAFLFYPGDYLGGTIGMTLEEKGGYMELLILQFNKGAFTIEQANKLLNGAFERLWPVLIEKFVEVEGKFFNRRLEEEKQKRENFVAFAKESGSRGGKKKWENKRNDSHPNSDPINHPISQNIPCAIENENRDEDVIEIEVVGESVRGEQLVPAMGERFKIKNPDYMLDQDDFPDLLAIAKKINKWQGWEGSIIQNEGKIKLRWGDLVDHIRNDPHASGYSISQINKLFKSITQSFSNKGHGKNGKPGFIESATKFMQQ